ncbi:MAG: flagellar biosynthesis protein FlhF [Pseudomonadota bacterium]
MKIKRFYAENSREALRQVREALGPDAIILSNRQVEGGVEIITAIDFDEDALLAQEEATWEAPDPTYAALAKRDAVPATPQVEAPAQPETGFAQHLQAALAQGRAEPGACEPPAAAPQRGDAEDDTRATVAALKGELEQMRRLVESRLAKTEPGPQEAAPAAARSSGGSYALMPLIQLGFTTRIARQILATLSSPTELSSDATLQEVLRRFIGEHLPLSGEKAERGGVLALMGPTGVGKTTTIAKLAARFSLKYGADQVALLTTDTYRIAGTEHLRVYGRILGIPVEVVPDGVALQERLDALAHKKLVLIDTVGFSPRDERIQKQLAILSAMRQRVQRVLVINAAAGRAHQQFVLDTYGSQGLDACIISKVDETPKLGEVLDLLLQLRLPVSFYTDGQRVPEDLHRAEVPALMDLLFQPMPKGRPEGGAEVREQALSYGDRLRLAGKAF